jgi:DNA-binding response OmpR family regulator
MSSQIVLIIDDEMDSCIIWKAFLSQLKFQVYTACTLHEGLELVEKLQPTFIFLDNNLPDGLGWDHLDNIRDIAPSSKIHLVSAYQFDTERWSKVNVNIVPKPFNMAHIRSLLVC